MLAAGCRFGAPVRVDIAEVRAERRAPEPSPADDPLPTPPEEPLSELDAKGDAAYQTRPELALAYWRWASVARIAALTGDRFTAPVVARFLDREALGARMRLALDDEFGPDELQGLEVTWRTFGLMAGDRSLGQTFAELLAEQVAGFYDPETQELALIAEAAKAEPGWFEALLGGDDRASQRLILDHEVTHALQDQVFDLHAQHARVEMDDDASLALSALVEGDAMVAMLLATLSPEERQGFLELPPGLVAGLLNTALPVLATFGGGAAYDAAPEVLRSMLLSPYTRGFGFALPLWAAGTTARRAAFCAPPRSTEQILYPDRPVAEPLRFVFPEEPRELAGWIRIRENTLGELTLQSLIGATAAEGWDGDTYRVYERGTGPPAEPGTAPGTALGTALGTAPGTAPGTALGTAPGTAPGTEPGTFTVWMSVWSAEEDAAQAERAVLARGLKGLRVARDGVRLSVFIGLPESLAEVVVTWAGRATLEAKRFPARPGKRPRVSAGRLPSVCDEAARAARASERDPGMEVFMRRAFAAPPQADPPLVRDALEALGVSRAEWVAESERRAERMCRCETRACAGSAIEDDLRWFETLRGEEVNGVDFDRMKRATERHAECAARLGR